MKDELFWKKYFKVYDRLNELIPYQELLSDIANELEIKDGEIIFEAGSGTGNLAMKIHEKGGQVVGMDTSETGISLHKKKLPESLVIIGDIVARLPFQDDYFDKVCSNNVIYTLEKEKRTSVLNEFYRVLKPGGMIVIANLAIGFKPWRIYFDHLKKDSKRNGLSETISRTIKLFIPTLKIFYYNYLIKIENGQGRYSFMEKDDHLNLLKNAGFRGISENKPVYSNHSDHLTNCP